MSRSTRALSAVAAAALVLPLIGSPARAAPGDSPIPAPQSIGTFCANPTAGGFSDVLSGGDANADELALAIRCLATADVAQGFPNGTYGPQAPVTRGQMASFIARLVDAASERERTPASIRELPAPAAGNPFPGDVAANDFRLNDIKRLAQARIVTGNPGTATQPQGIGADRYGPELPVTRSQMASFLNRAVAYMTGGDPARAGTAGNGFAAPTAEYYVDPQQQTHLLNIRGITVAGISNGVGGQRYDGPASVSRQQMARFIARTIADLYDQDRVFSLLETLTDQVTAEGRGEATRSTGSGDGSSRFLEFTGLTPRTDYRVTLVRCDSVTRSGSDQVTFTRGADGTLDAGAPTARILGVGRGESGDAAPAGTTNTLVISSESDTGFSILIGESTAPECVIAVLHLDGAAGRAAGQGGTNPALELDSAGRPTEPFGITGRTTFTAAAVPPSSSPSQTVSPGPSESVSPSPSPSPSETVSPSPSPGETVSPSPSETVSPSPTQSPAPVAGQQAVALDPRVAPGDTAAASVTSTTAGVDVASVTVSGACVEPGQTFLDEDPAVDGLQISIDILTSAAEGSDCVLTFQTRFDNGTTDSDTRTTRVATQGVAGVEIATSTAPGESEMATVTGNVPIQSVTVTGSCLQDGSKTFAEDADADAPGFQLAVQVDGDAENGMCRLVFDTLFTNGTVDDTQRFIDVDAPLRIRDAFVATDLATDSNGSDGALGTASTGDVLQLTFDQAVATSSATTLSVTDDDGAANVIDCGADVVRFDDVAAADCVLSEDGTVLTVQLLEDASADDRVCWDMKGCFSLGSVPLDYPLTITSTSGLVDDDGQGVDLDSSDREIDVDDRTIREGQAVVQFPDAVAPGDAVMATVTGTTDGVEIRSVTVNGTCLSGPQTVTEDQEPAEDGFQLLVLIDEQATEGSFCDLTFITTFDNGTTDSDVAETRVATPGEQQIELQQTVAAGDSAMATVTSTTDGIEITGVSANGFCLDEDYSFNDENPDVDGFQIQVPISADAEEGSCVLNIRARFDNGTVDDDQASLAVVVQGVAEVEPVRAVAAPGDVVAATATANVDIAAVSVSGDCVVPGSAEPGEDGDQQTVPFDVVIATGATGGPCTVTVVTSFQNGSTSDTDTIEITVVDESEPNDTRETADALPAGRSVEVVGRGGEGANGAADTDFFSFTLTETTAVTGSTSGDCETFNGDTRLRLYVAGTPEALVDDDDTGGAHCSRVEQTLVAGDYFFEVAPFGGGQSPYDYVLHVSFTQPAG
jgi:hypothetical protein